MSIKSLVQLLLFAATFAINFYILWCTAEYIHKQILYIDAPTCHYTQARLNANCTVVCGELIINAKCGAKPFNLANVRAVRRDDGTMHFVTLFQEIWYKLIFCAATISLCVGFVVLYIRDKIDRDHKQELDIESKGYDEWDTELKGYDKQEIST